VQDRQGRWFALRIRPYKNVDNRIDGAVLSLFDIDALHCQEVELRELRHYAEAVVEAVRQPLVVLDHELRVRTANASFLAAAGLEIDVVRGRPFLDLANGEWGGEALRHALARMADGGSDDRVVVRVSPAGVTRAIRVEARRIEGPAGRPSLILLAFTEGGAEADDGEA